MRAWKCSLIPGQRGYQDATKRMRDLADKIRIEPHLVEKLGRHGFGTHRQVAGESAGRGAAAQVIRIDYGEIAKIFVVFRRAL